MYQLRSKKDKVDKLLLSVVNIIEPKTFKDVMNSPQKNEWFQAMQEELKCIEDNNTWNLTDLPRDRKSVGSKWVLKLKRDDKDNVAQYRQG